jgi:hypothetical protein
MVRVARYITGGAVGDLSGNLTKCIPDRGAATIFSYRSFDLVTDLEEKELVTCLFPPDAIRSEIGVYLDVAKPHRKSAGSLEVVIGRE